MLVLGLRIVDLGKVYADSVPVGAVAANAFLQACVQQDVT